jgi:hypothetical protein
MGLVQPVLAFNVLNANSELKRLNELLFKELLANYGEKLFVQFDDKCSDIIRGLAGLVSAPTQLGRPAEELPAEETGTTKEQEG